MNFQKRIEQKLFAKKEKSAFDVYCNIIFNLSKEFKWTPQEINEMPIPLVFKMNELLNDYYEKKAKAMKK